MNKQVWSDEAARFLAMTADAKWRWLAKLLFTVTMLARDTYVVGGDSIDNPVRMRRFNELAHRVASQLRVIADGASGMPDDIFCRMVGDELTALHVDVETLTSMLQSR